MTMLDPVFECSKGTARLKAECYLLGEEESSVLYDEGAGRGVWSGATRSLLALIPARQGKQVKLLAVWVLPLQTCNRTKRTYACISFVYLSLSFSA